MNIPNPYTLPAINFVGGSTQEFIFHCYYYQNRRPYNMSSCTANFALINYVNKTGTPIVSKPMRMGNSPNVLTVVLDPSDTVSLPTGKYIYQISIRDVSGEIDIPNQGIIHIVNNINKQFV